MEEYLRPEENFVHDRDVDISEDKRPDISLKETDKKSMVDQEVVDNFMNGLVLLEPEENQCGGLFFRCKDTQYVGSRGELVFKTVFYPLKKMSCKGCPQCWYLQDELNQISSCEEVLCETIRNNGIYRFDTTNISYDFETGSPDDRDLEMVLQTQEEGNK